MRLDPGNRIVMFALRSQRRERMSKSSPKRRPQDVAALAHEHLARNRRDAVHTLHDALKDAGRLPKEIQQRKERLSRAVSHVYECDWLRNKRRS